ncbi:hypothetical protein K1719_034955 [Acacia pycnantha]|nr:hypothetical protein K1719_034955 [Acacia pycnantha]
MKRVWLSLKTSLHCKSETSDVHVPKSKTHLTATPTGRRSGCSCSRSISNLKDVINGGSSNIRHSHKPPCHSPRSIGSSELLNSITHEVILTGAGSTFVGTLRPGTPSSFRNSEKSSPFLVSDSSEGGFVASKRFSIEVDSNGYYSCASCCKCGEKLCKREDAESHHLSKHAVTELVEGDSSRKIVEMICRTRWMKPEKRDYYCSRIMDKVLKVHNTQKTLARFEEYRESVKMRASKLQNKKHPRCLADGNELLRFYATTLSCSLGGSNTSLCVSEDCCVCRIIRNGFSVKNGNGIGIFTAATSGRALESVEDDGGDDNDEGSEKKKKVLIVCRVIAGRVHRPLMENVVKDMVGLQQNGFDSLAGKLGIHSNIEELYLLNPSSLLPCFVVICKP